RCLQSARSKPVHRINRDHDREAAVLQASGEEIVGRRVASEDMYRIACSAERETDLADKDRERNISVDVCRIPLPEVYSFKCAEPVSIIVSDLRHLCRVARNRALSKFR